MDALDVREKKTAARIEAYEKKISIQPKVLFARYLTDLEKFEEKEKEKRIKLAMAAKGASFKKLSLSEACVYALLDPRTKDVFYVGSTNNLHRRWKQHRAADSIQNMELHEHLLSIREKGCTPLFAVLEKVAEIERRLEREKQWVSFFKDLEIHLFNSEKYGSFWS